MKWLALALFTAVVAAPLSAQAQKSVYIGSIATIADTSASLWGYGGLEMFVVKRSEGNNTPIMRTLTYDARCVEILSRTQAPPLQSKDVRAVSEGGHDYILVRGYLLMEVTAADAQSAEMSKSALASKWASAVGRVLPQVAPKPNRLVL